MKKPFSPARLPPQSTRAPPATAFSICASAFASPTLNQLVAQLLSPLLLVRYSAFKAAHLLHHEYNQSSLDPKIGKVANEAVAGGSTGDATIAVTIGLDEAPRFAVIDDAKLALRIFYRIAGVLPESLGDAQLAGLKQVLRCVRLHAGEGTEAHHDVARECTQGMHSHLSVVVFLNENQGRDRGFVGGGIEFPTLGLHVPAKTGRALVFPHELLHRDALIERGDAFVLHAEVFYARDWLPLP